MIFPALITLLALILYQVLTFNVGHARGKYGVKAPATTGNPDFERYFRVQANTLEQLIVFLPSMWLFGGAWPKPMLGNWTGPEVAAAIGAVWILSRILYAKGYYANSEKRYFGMIVSLLCSLVLSFGALFGIVKKLLIIYPIHLHF